VFLPLQVPTIERTTGQDLFASIQPRPVISFSVFIS
jgi:hypothetical protein